MPQTVNVGKVSFTDCVPPQMRRPLDRLAYANNNVIAPLAPLIQKDGDTITVQISSHYITPASPTIVAAGGSASYKIRGALVGNLVKDGTASIAVGTTSISVDGYFVPENYYIAAGQRVGASQYLVNGQLVWSVDVTADCLTQGSPP